MKHKIYLLAVLLTAMASVDTIQSQGVVTPCPEVLINQKYDHVVNPTYRQHGWDTAVTCSVRTIELSAEPYIPVQYFNGTYTVEEIEYNPADSTFHGGTELPTYIDDGFNSVTNIPFPFYFFGQRKNGFVVGNNGLITFDQTAAGQHCEWSLQNNYTIPWQRASEHLNDAIFGIYEDIHPGQQYLNNNDPLYQGTWYGIQGSFPCLKIICSWNDIPIYPASANSNNRSTYQIVCYEGTNIIEIHVKKRSLSSTGWNGNRGIIGIINSTGLPQQPGTIGESNHFVTPNSPAAFYPSGYNPTTSALDSIAFRFTPQGTTLTTHQWYRIFDDGRDSVALTTNPDDTNGYYVPMNSNDPNHPTLTKAYVSPTCNSRYVLQLSFSNANRDFYHLFDTITIGADYSSTEFDAATPNGQILHYTVNPDSTSVTITGHEANISGDLVIPGSIVHCSRTYTITSIGESAFENCQNLLSVSIPNNVTEIGKYAFLDCTGLTNVVIPNTVTHIHSGAFGRCTNLASVDIPNSVISIGEYTFINGYGTGLTIVQMGAFSGCTSITSVSIPSSVTLIGTATFWGCSNLTSVTIPSSTDTIGYLAFRYCENLRSVTSLATTPPFQAASDAFSGVPDDCILFIPCESRAAYQTAGGWSNFTNIQCLDSQSVTTDTVDIRTCTGQTLLFEMNNRTHTATVIGYVGQCEGGLTVPAWFSIDDVRYTVTAIGPQAFQNCTGLTEVTLPVTITLVDQEAFKGCSGLLKVDMK